MQLFLCEKPSQAKDIARVLGISKREQGFISGGIPCARPAPPTACFTARHCRPSSTSWARCACVLPCRSWPVRPGSLRWMMYSVWSATACATASGSELARRLQIEHYPVLITDTGLTQQFKP